MSGLREALAFLLAQPLDPLAERLLLDSARPAARPPAAAPSAGAATWSTVLALAEAHNTLPTCAFRFADAEGLSDAARERLLRIREEVRSLDRLYVAVLGNLLDVFAAHGLPVMVLKGARIAEQLYEHPAARMGKDIDLLVRRSDLQAAGDLLAARGFACRDRAYYDAHHFHHTWVHGTRPLAERVELHWDVTLPGSSVRFPVESWWRSPAVARLRAGDALVPPAADEFAYIAYHATCRRTPRLRDLGDVAGLWARSSPADREAMLERAAGAGALGYVATACGLAHACWGLEGYAVAARTAHPFFARHIYAPRRVAGHADRTWWAIEEVGAWSLQAPGRADAKQLLTAAPQAGERSPWARPGPPPPRWKVAGAMLGAGLLVGLAAALRRFSGTSFPSEGTASAAPAAPESADEPGGKR